MLANLYENATGATWSTENFEPGLFAGTIEANSSLCSGISHVRRRFKKYFCHLVQLYLLRQNVEFLVVLVGALALGFPFCEQVWGSLCPLAVRDDGVGEALRPHLELK